MFAQIPQTHSFQRAYSSLHPTGGGGHPTTSKKNINKENAHALSSKTPCRGGQSHRADDGPLKFGAPSTVMRQGLGVKTVERNAGNPAQAEEIEPKRLFQAPNGKSLPPSKSLSSMPHILPPRITKTPGPNRIMPPSTSRANNLRTPAPSRAMPIDPTPLPLPSAQRARRSSARLSASTSSPGSMTDGEIGLRTPAPAPGPGPGTRWEEEASLDHITEGVEGLEIAEQEVEDEDGEDWEIEYMPPTAQEPNHEPIWTPPDLEFAFNKMSKAPPLWQIHEDLPIAPPSPKLKFDEVSTSLSKPIFRRAAAPVAQAQLSALKPVTQKNVPRTLSSKSASKPALKVPIRKTVPLSRPGNSRPVTLATSQSTSSQLKTQTSRMSSTIRAGQGKTPSQVNQRPVSSTTRPRPKIVHAASLRAPTVVPLASRESDHNLNLVSMDLDAKLFDT